MARVKRSPRSSDSRHSKDRVPSPARQERTGTADSASKRQTRKSAPPAKRAAGDAQPRAARPAPSAAPAWLLRCAPGLAKTLVTELRFNALIDRRTKPTLLWQRNHDLVFLPRLQREPRPGDLRIAEEVHRCPVYGRYKISHHQLDVMAAALTAPKKPWHLVVSVDGTRFNRHELARWLARELQQRRAPLDEQSNRLASLFCVEDAYYFCLPFRMADDAALRQHRVAEREGSLPPTIAAAMAFLANPRDADTVLDPVCGSGTLLAELHAYAPGAQLTGIDLDRQAIAAARRNLAHLPQVQLSVGDARSSGLPDGGMTLFLANLPFGKQFGSRPENRQLYPDILRELVRLGRPEGWRAILLTSDLEALQAAVTATPPVRIVGKNQVKIRGEAAVIATLRPG
jgi:SAM-dependent methyltransferase